MSLSLKLELQADNQVVVTNLETQEQKEVSLEFLRNITNDSLSFLIQYGTYELIINAQRYWSLIKNHECELNKLKSLAQQNNLQQLPSSPKIFSLSLCLELKSNNQVLVTNSETKEQKEVTLKFLHKITNDSLSILIQYGTYELIVNAQQHWQKILNFNPEQEKNNELYIEQKFREIMVNDSWITITDYEKEMYAKALAWADLYNPNQNKNGAMLATGSGAVTGALISNSIGGVGIAAGGTAIGIGMLGLTAMGAIAGLAVYGLGKALE